MGLYDSPLPPRPSPRKNNPNKSTRNNFRANDENDDDDDEFEDEVPLLLTERLFSFDQSGKEIRGLLPPLRRRLDSGVACYFEATDRLVLNLVEKTACHPDDAGWALEACQGDITQAWTSISVARRLALNRDQQIANEAQDAEYDPDDYEMEVLEEYQQRKTKLNAELKKRNRDEYLRLSEPDAPWLPTKNPRPVEDEPWFTG